MIGNYPISEKTDTYSLKLDHNFSDKQQIFFRFSGTPSKVSGIQVNGQNQVFGQNSFSRTSRQDFTDLNVVAGDTWNNGSHSLNDLRFQYARRRLGYDPADTPTGQQVAITMNPAHAALLFEGSGHTFDELLALDDAGKPLPRFPLAARLTARIAVSSRLRIQRSASDSCGGLISLSG